MHPQRNRKNKTALITGAAQGTGFALAEHLAEQGYDLLIVDIQEDKLCQAAEQLRKNADIEVNCLPLDLSQLDAAETVYRFCNENQIEVFILINNAGRFAFDRIADMAANTFNSILQLHVNTPAKLSKYFGADMKARQEGYILFLSSLSAWMPYPYISLYASTKRFLCTFSRAIHFEFAEYNVGVTTVCPGAVDTDLYELSDRLRRIARRLGIMIPPDKLAKHALKRMFRKRVTYIPGLFNKVVLPLLLICPVRLLTFFYKKLFNSERKVWSLQQRK